MQVKESQRFMADRILTPGFYSVVIIMSTDCRRCESREHRCQVYECVLVNPWEIFSTSCFLGADVLTGFTNEAQEVNSAANLCHPVWFCYFFKMIRDMDEQVMEHGRPSHRVYSEPQSVGVRSFWGFVLILLSFVIDAAQGQRDFTNGHNHRGAKVANKY